LIHWLLRFSNGQGLVSKAGYVTFADAAQVVRSNRKNLGLDFVLRSPEWPALKRRIKNWQADFLRA
jgi:hypothetical protein